jgi:hypothetical protein
VLRGLEAKTHTAPGLQEVGSDITAEPAGWRGRVRVIWEKLKSKTQRKKM